MPTAYEGKEPYIFISYAHKDQEEVLGYIDALQSRGFRVWFDGGIQAGTEWPENIATHLRKCACVLSFVSENFVDSDHCRRELAFSQDLKINQLSVFIQNLQPESLPDGIRLQLGLNQAMFRENFSSEEAFVAELARAPMIQECLGEAVSVPSDGEEKKRAGKMSLLDHLCNRIYDRVGETQREKKEHWIRASKSLVWIVVLLELAYIPISNLVIGWVANNYDFHTVHVSLILQGILIGVHVFLAWSNLSVYVFMRKLVRLAGIDQKPLRDARYYMNCAVLASFLISVVMQTEIFVQLPFRMVYSFLPYPFSAIMNAVMINAYPAVAAVLFYMLLRDKKK